MNSKKHPTTNRYAFPINTSTLSSVPQLSVRLRATAIQSHQTVTLPCCNYLVQHTHPPSKSHASVATLSVAAFQGSLMSKSGTGRTCRGLPRTRCCAKWLHLSPLPITTHRHLQVSSCCTPSANPTSTTLGTGTPFLAFFLTYFYTLFPSADRYFFFP